MVHNHSIHLLFKIKDVTSLMMEVKRAVQIKFDARHKPPLNPTRPKDGKFNNDADISLQLPETPSDEPQPKDDNEITCLDLFRTIKNNDERVLIIDVRSDKDYAEARMAFPEYMVHFPADMIKPRCANKNVLKVDIRN